MEKRATIVIILISTAAKNLWPFLWPQVYFQLTAIAWLLLCALLCRLLSNRYTWILFVLSAADCLDEFFFDPAAFEINEYIACIVVSLIFLLKDDKKRKKNVRRLRYSGWGSPDVV